MLLLLFLCKTFLSNIKWIFVYNSLDFGEFHFFEVLPRTWFIIELLGRLNQKVLHDIQNNLCNVSPLSLEQPFAFQYYCQTATSALRDEKFQHLQACFNKQNAQQGHRWICLRHIYFLQFFVTPASMQTWYSFGHCIICTI